MRNDTNTNTGSHERRRRQRDDGAILPIILVMTVVFTLVIASVATFVTTGLRYGKAVELRADRLAAADGGLRYGVERLRNFEDLCTTGAGTSGGYTTIFPPQINGADTSVTCRRVGGNLSDLQGWGLVVTGVGVPAGQDMFEVNGSAGFTNVKKLRGPAYVNDVSRLGFNATLIVEDGDLWHTESSCATPITVPEVGTSLLFEPSFLRGPSCTELNWTELFTPPTRSIPTPQALATPGAFDDFSFPGCRIFEPGTYTSMPTLDADNYFKSGDYYFENVDFNLISESVTFGFPSGSGDTQKIAAAPSCTNAMYYDQNTSGERGGATIWMGGSSRIEVGNMAEFEIFRRQQFETYMSINAIGSNGAGFIKSTMTYTNNVSTNWILQTQSGNTNDVAIHGLLWAPESKAQLGNVTNSAVGQLIGGLVVAHVDVQASASANSFAIGVEGNPVEGYFLMESTATKNGRSTSIRAIVQYRPDTRALGLNSWRVAD